ncbi:hypothetical protein STEG23_030077, partial [Scotinomys teguina]
LLDCGCSFTHLDCKRFTTEINNVNDIVASNFRAGEAVKAYCTVIVCIQMDATAKNDGKIGNGTLEWNVLR